MKSQTFIFDPQLTPLMSTMWHHSLRTIDVQLPVDVDNTQQVNTVASLIDIFDRVFDQSCLHAMNECS